jgi:hypothetical protein
MSEWQPIETYKSKKRGQFAVFYFPQIESGRMTLGALVTGDGPNYGMRRATHWMPLPAAPMQGDG